DRFSVGQVNIVDIADAALHFGTSDPYWGNPLYTCTGGTSVDICAVGTAAADFGHGLTTPFPETGAGSLSLIDSSGLAYSINPADALGESACSNVCIFVQQLIVEGGTVHIRGAYVGSTTAASLV